jgi:hypothetical protein
MGTITIVQPSVNMDKLDEIIDGLSTLEDMMKLDSLPDRTMTEGECLAIIRSLTAWKTIQEHLRDGEEVYLTPVGAKEEE